MTEQQAEKVFVGDDVRRSDGIAGKVMTVGFNFVRVKWSDGQDATFTRSELIPYVAVA